MVFRRARASVSPLVVVGWGPRCLEAPRTHRWPTAGFHNFQKAPRIKLPFGDLYVPPLLEDTLSTRASDMGDLTHPQRSTFLNLPFASVDVLTFKIKPPRKSHPQHCLLDAFWAAYPPALWCRSPGMMPLQCAGLITAHLPSVQSSARLFWLPASLNIAASFSFQNVTTPH